MSFTCSTYTFALEWVQEVPAHFAVISRRSRRVVHAPHVIRGTLEGERAEKNIRLLHLSVESKNSDCYEYSANKNLESEN